MNFDEYDNDWIGEWVGYKRPDSKYCDCHIPKVVNLSLFRPLFICDSCGREIDHNKLIYKDGTNAKNAQ